MSYKLIFCGEIREDLKAFFDLHFALASPCCLPLISSLATFDIYALDPHWKTPANLPKHIIFFGLPDTIAIQTPRFTPFDWVKTLEDAGHKVTFIHCSDQWREKYKKQPETTEQLIAWDVIELNKSELSPVERLLDTLSSQRQSPLNQPLLHYVYKGVALSPEHFKLVDKLADSLHFRVLDKLAFAVLPDTDRAFFLPALLLLRRSRAIASAKFSRHEYAATAVFAFFYTGDQFPLLESSGTFDKLPLAGFHFYADIDTFNKVRRQYENIPLYTSNSSHNSFSLRFVIKKKSSRFHQATSQACLALMGSNRLLHH